MRVLTSFVSGVLFALGLAVSGMTDPANVIGFLDVTGTWRPALAFVMGAALLVYAIAYQLVKRRGKPVFDNKLHLPEERRVTSRLVVGSLMFGAGWGLAGFCPGPAIVSLGSFSLGTTTFVAAMLAGAWVVRGLSDRSSRLHLGAEHFAQ